MEKTARNVQTMFGEIAPYYDFLNHLLSLGLDISWRKTAVAMARKAGFKTPTILDICCGTGDLTQAFRKGFPEAECVIGSDFSPKMVELAEAKRKERDVGYYVGDALHLPHQDGSVDIISVAFGIRNVVDLDRGLEEMKRVLKPGGMALILEFMTPQLPIIRSLYRLYFHRVLPTVGNRLSKTSVDAYTYLPESVEEFPPPEELESRMQTVGFQDVGHRRMSMGIVAVHHGRK